MCKGLPIAIEASLEEVAKTSVRKPRPLWQCTPGTVAPGVVSSGKHGETHPDPAPMSCTSEETPTPSLGPTLLPTNLNKVLSEH